MERRSRPETGRRVPPSPSRPTTRQADDQAGEDDDLQRRPRKKTKTAPAKPKPKAPPKARPRGKGKGKAAGPNLSPIVEEGEDADGGNDNAGEDTGHAPPEPPPSQEPVQSIETAQANVKVESEPSPSPPRSISSLQDAELATLRSEMTKRGLNYGRIRKTDTLRERIDLFDRGRNFADRERGPGGERQRSEPQRPEDPGLETERQRFQLALEEAQAEAYTRGERAGFRMGREQVQQVADQAREKGLRQGRLEAEAHLEEQLNDAWHRGRDDGQVSYLTDAERQRQALNAQMAQQRAAVAQHRLVAANSAEAAKRLILGALREGYAAGEADPLRDTDPSHHEDWYDTGTRDGMTQAKLEILRARDPRESREGHFTLRPEEISDEAVNLARQDALQEGRRCGRAEQYRLLSQEPEDDSYHEGLRDGWTTGCKDIARDNEPTMSLVEWLRQELHLPPEGPEMPEASLEERVEDAEASEAHHRLILENFIESRTELEETSERRRKTVKALADENKTLRQRDERLTRDLERAVANRGALLNYRDYYDRARNTGVEPLPNTNESGDAPEGMLWCLEDGRWRL